MRKRKLAALIITAIVTVAPARAAYAADEPAEVQATLVSCGLPIAAMTLSIAQEEQLTDCLKAKADSGQLYPDLIFGLSKSLEDEGHRAASLKYLMYLDAVMEIDLAGCNNNAYNNATELILFTSAKVANDPAVTLDVKRGAVRDALALEAATAATRRHPLSFCLAHGRGPYTGAPDKLYAPEPIWRERRAAILKTLEPTLLMMVGIRRASSASPKP